MKFIQGFSFPSHVILSLLQVLQKLWDIAEINPISVFNLSNEEEEISIKNLAELCTNLFIEKNIKVEYQISNNNNVYTNYKRSKLDNSKLYNLGWKIKIDLKNGIKKTVLSFL